MPATAPSSSRVIGPTGTVYGQNPPDNFERARNAFATRAATPGALPIVVDGEVIGSMGMSSADGEKCAQAAIDAVFKKGTPPAP